MTTPTKVDNRPLADMSLLDPTMLECPYHYDKTLRDEAPVYQDPATGVYVVATYELVREAHKAPNVFSNEFTLALGSARTLDPDVDSAIKDTYNLGKGTLLTVDDPDHKNYRDSVKDFFLINNVAQYRPWIENFADRLVEEIPMGQPYNFIDQFARPLPLSVIMHVLGIPLELFDKAFKWTVANVNVLSQIASKEVMIESAAALKESYDWFAVALDERRAEPRDDLLNVVAHAEFNGRPMTIEEQLSMCAQFLVAGNETTTATLAEGIRQLCLNPEQEALVRADRSLIPNLVDESLRTASPTSNMWRMTTADYTLGGVNIPANSMVLLKYFSSNHDESMFEQAMEFDISRSNLKRHIAFGFGTHVCIGQHLSRLEMIVAWEKLLEGTSSFRLNCEPETLEYMPNVLLRGLEEVPVIFEK